MLRSSTFRTYGAAAAIALATATAIGTAAPVAAAGAASAPVPAEIFACQANPISALAAGQAAPNAPQRCLNDQIGGQQGPRTVGGVQFQAVDATGATARTGAAAMTASTAGTATVTRHSTTQSGRAESSAASAKLVVGKTTIQLGAVTSTSNISCTYSSTGSRYTYNSRSTVQSVKINGRAVKLRNGASSIKLAGGTLHLNRSVKTAAGIVQQAAVLETAGAKVMVGQSAAAIAKTPGNPCKS